jgi:hypothetical protein
LKAVVIDVNVPLVANGQAEQAGDDCILASLDALEHAKTKQMVVLDDAWLILTEYQKKLNSTGQPGAGDAFLKGLLQNIGNPKHCELVPITGRRNQFTEFPTDPDLQSFDPSDRKYVAVALGSNHNPKIINAVDTDWWHHREVLKRNGVQVEFICPDAMTRPKQKAARGRGKR